MGRIFRIAALALLAVGCATPPPKRVVPPPEEPAPPPPPPVRMAILPVENDAYPKVADALNEVFKTVEVKTAEEYLRPKVTLDVVQLQIECLEATEACYGAVGKSLSVNLLLIGQLARPEKKQKGVRVTVTLFNVDTGATLNAIDRVFRKQDEAIKAMGQVVAETLGAPGVIADAGR